MHSAFTPAQLRGARGMLNWTILWLSIEADVSPSTVKRLETRSAQGVSAEIRGGSRASSNAPA